MMQGASVTSTSAQSRSSPWQFSLASLLGVMLAVALFCSVWQIAPQLAVFVTATFSATVVAWRLIRTLRRRERRVGPWLAMSVLLCWSIGYVASVGPAVALTQHTILFDGSVDTIYAPLDWLYRETQLERPLEWYLAYWRGPDWRPRP